MYSRLSGYGRYDTVCRPEVVELRSVHAAWEPATGRPWWDIGPAGHWPCSGIAVSRRGAPQSGVHRRAVGADPVDECPLLHLTAYPRVEAAAATEQYEAHLPVLDHPGESP